MKATGIVRRIDECVIIGQGREKRMNTGFFADSVQTIKRKSDAFSINFSESEVHTQRKNSLPQIG